MPKVEAIKEFDSFSDFDSNLGLQQHNDSTNFKVVIGEGKGLWQNPTEVKLYTTSPKEDICSLLYSLNLAVNPEVKQSCLEMLSFWPSVTKEKRCFETTQMISAFTFRFFATKCERHCGVEVSRVKKFVKPSWWWHGRSPEWCYCIL